MSGHSKWSTIKRQKGVTDAKRGAVFTKLTNVIAISTREGGPDPDNNFKLRLAIEKARQANMPKENIQRAIDKGSGKSIESNLSQAIFEGFGPEGIAVVVETITDNSTRTASELRNLFEKNGGNLASPGAVSYLFTRVGEIEVVKNEKVFENAVEAGAIDIEENDDSFAIFTATENLHAVKEKLISDGLTINSAELIFKPNKESMITVSENDKLEKITNFFTAIEDLDDVQNIYTNLA